MTGCKKFFDPKTTANKKISLSVEGSVLELLKFNGKKVRSVHLKDVYEAIGYGKENDKKAIQSIVPGKYKLRFGDAKSSLKKREEMFPLHPDTVLLREPGLYCFLLRCKKPKAKPFMEWDLETVLPRKVRKLSWTIEQKDAALQERDNQIQAIQY